MNLRPTQEEYLQAFRVLDSVRQRLLRAVACEMLKAFGAPEIGSSDVSCQIFHIFQYHKAFTDDVLTALRDEWLGWTASSEEHLSH